MNYSPDTSGCGGRCLVDLIRARAYQLYQSRNQEPHHELDDWLRAENEVKQQLGFSSLWEESHFSFLVISELPERSDAHAPGRPEHSGKYSHHER